MPKLTTQNSNIHFSSVEEKIKVEKHLPFEPGHKTGPDVNLFFHELTSEQNGAQQLLQLFVSLLISLCFFISLPFLALFIKIKSTGPIFIRKTYTGKRGRPFQLLTYNLGDTESFPSTTLSKLPAIINVWKGDLNLVGPHVYPEEWCNSWNEEFSDFYKRFSLKPGFWGVAPAIQEPEDLDHVASILKEEFKYIRKPTLTKDLKTILGLS